MKTTQEWITEIDFSVQQLKSNNRKSYYGFSLAMNQETASLIKAYFEKEENSVEIKVCARKNFDLIITW